MTNGEHKAKNFPGKGNSVCEALKELTHWREETMGAGAHQTRTERVQDMLRKGRRCLIIQDGHRHMGTKFYSSASEPEAVLDIMCLKYTCVCV